MYIQHNTLSVRGDRVSWGDHGSLVPPAVYCLRLPHHPCLLCQGTCIPPHLFHVHAWRQLSECSGPAYLSYLWQVSLPRGLLPIVRRGTALTASLSSLELLEALPALVLQGLSTISMVSKYLSYAPSSTSSPNLKNPSLSLVKQNQIKKKKSKQKEKKLPKNPRNKSVLCLF